MTTEQLTALGISNTEWLAMGPIEKLYLDVTQRLGDKLGNKLAWIELEDGQLELPEDSYAVQFPCALIDFPSAEFQDETLGNQQGIIMLQVRIAIDLYEDLYMADANRSPDSGMAVKRLSLITAVHKALHGFETDYSTKLVRVSISTERRDDGLKVFSLIYACAAKDDTAAVEADVIDDATLLVQRFD